MVNQGRKRHIESEDSLEPLGDGGEKCHQEQFRLPNLRATKWLVGHGTQVHFLCCSDRPTDALAGACADNGVGSSNTSKPPSVRIYFDLTQTFGIITRAE